MDYLVKQLKPVLTLLFLAVITFYGCSSREAITERSFVGKWKSSKLATPVYLYANGEWEIKTEEGAILQYGVWEFKNKKIIWSYKIDSSVGHDPNVVLLANSREFQVRESDGSITTFSKLD